MGGRLLSLVGLVLASVVTFAGLPAAAQTSTESVHDTEHFSVFYDTDPASDDAPDLTDADGDGVPDAIERLGAALEYAWAAEIDEMDYRPPPVEGRYEVHISAGVNSAHVRPAPGGIGRSRASYIGLSPDAIRPERPDIEISELAAHEFFHGVQYGYDYLSDRWFQEASATWIEVHLFGDSLLEDLTIPAFLLTPEAGLTRTGNLREYGAFLFLEYLTETHGGSDPAGLIREVWQLMAEPLAFPSSPHLGSLDAIDQVLTARGSSLEDAWAEFIVWQRRLGLFDDGASYRAAVAGTGWPTFARRDVASSDTCRLDLGKLPEVASTYGRVRLKGPAMKTGRLAITGPNDSVGFYTLKRKGRSATVPVEFSGGTAAVDLSGAPFKPRSVVVGVGSTRTPDERFGLSVRDPAAPSNLLVAAPSGPSDVTYGISGSFSGSLLCAGVPAPFARLRLVATESYSGEVSTVDLITDEKGRWQLRTSPDASSRLTIEVVDGLLPEGVSEPHLVSVHVFVSMEPTDATIDEGDPVVVTGDITPATEGSSLVLEYRRPSRRRWNAGPVVTTDAAGHYEAAYVLPAPGLWEVRTRQIEDLDPHRAPGVSISSLIEVNDR